MFEFQIYWPAWWHLIPSFDYREGSISEPANWYACWSIFQFRGYR